MYIRYILDIISGHSDKEFTQSKAQSGALYAKQSSYNSYRASKKSKLLVNSNTTHIKRVKSQPKSKTEWAPLPRRQLQVWARRKGHFMSKTSLFEAPNSPESGLLAPETVIRWPKLAQNTRMCNTFRPTFVLLKPVVCPFEFSRQTFLY